MKRTRPSERGVILAIDQGTTQTKALLVDGRMRIMAEAAHEFPLYYPRPGWVEQEPEEIWSSVVRAIGSVLSQARLDPRRIAAVGITNQRETVVVYDRRSLRPVGRAIVWQDRRTASACEELRARGVEPRVRNLTGLVLDPYFSATKLAWILEHHRGARGALESGKLRWGTIDTYLIARLSSGAAYSTDPSNASRTLLFPLKGGGWNENLAEIFRVPERAGAAIVSHHERAGATQGLSFLPDGIPIAAPIGDQQAALFAQACFSPGEAKCTYGTGAFLLANTGEKIVRSKNGLLTTVAWRFGGKTTFALEGAVFVAGAAVQWLRDGLGIIRSSADVEKLAASVPDTGGVVFVPALTGLGAPHWRPDARGLVSGLTRGTSAAHIARAGLEGIAFQCHDLLKAMESDMGKRLKLVKVDGGAAANDLLMQFQADILGRPIARSTTTSLTGLGAAYIAGMAAGMCPSLASIRAGWAEEKRFKPKMRGKDVEGHLARWRAAIGKA